jgi:phosphopantothenoylcysteine decarboxylase / phosphopantothenate---cysteine ligase
MFKGKKILVGITGSIAAYKAAILVRLLIKKGAEVKVLMTPLAKEFITPLTLATLSKNKIAVDFFNPENGDWNSHVDMGLWADLYLIAPATANTMAKMAAGICDNLLLTTYFSAKCPVFIAPAMDLDMFNHPATQKSINILRSYGNIIIEPATGELASGLEGKGRMEEPELIMKSLLTFVEKQQKLQNKRFLVTAGPTYEAIDAVRFIGNYSSGKMGYAIAEELAACGAMVILISGPVNLKVNHHKIKRINVTSAQEMYNACMKEFPNTDGAVLNAAVADFSPENVSTKKIKRRSKDLNIKLKPTIDIAAELGKIKKKKQLLVGFALETDDELENAKAKLKKKKLDFIVLNSLNEPGAGFNTDTNKITIIDKRNKISIFGLKLKMEVAKDIVDKMIEYILVDRSENP